MTIPDIAKLRLHSQYINRNGCSSPDEIVGWLGAVQAQDYAAAKWAIGLRIPGVTDDAIEDAFNSGAILRTHTMRPTWHFVAPADIRWIQELTASRVNAQCAFMNRKMELDEAIFRRTNKMIIKALQGNKHLTRNELGALLQKAGIAINDLRLTCLMMRSELDAMICSGPRKGKQFTYALLEERAPEAEAKALKRDESLAALASRYFTSHGPATLQDFAWWSGLTAADAKKGIEMVKSEFLKETIDGQTYWFTASADAALTNSQAAHLLPNYDEYIIAYKDRMAAVDPGKDNKLSPRANVIFNNAIIINGRVAGTWKRTIVKDKVMIGLTTFKQPNKGQKQAISAAADKYGEFLGLKAELIW